MDELAAETIAARFGEHGSSDTPADPDVLTAFIGSVETGDPEWASTDTAALRKAADTRRSPAHAIAFELIPREADQPCPQS